jgi:hypothetical protein
MREKGETTMTQELDLKIRKLRDDMTRLVREGMDEDGTVLRRMLAELERLENLRSALRQQSLEGLAYPIAAHGDLLGGTHASLAV